MYDCSRCHREVYDIIDHEEAPTCIICLKHICDSKVDMVGDVEAFHRKFDLAYDDKPRMMPTQIFNVKINALQEELKEYGEASAAGYQNLLQMALFEPLKMVPFLAGQFDGLLDIAYVAIGNAYLQGFPIREGWRRVHGSNMLKERAKVAEDSKRGSTFDVIKPKGWKEPDLKSIVEDNVHDLAPTKPNRYGR